MSAGHFSQVARGVMLVLILAGALAGVTSLMRREQPGMVPILGLVVNMVPVGLFWHFRFYAVGFDKDMWHLAKSSFAAHRSLAAHRSTVCHHDFASARD
jgi:hypothetical protein